MMGKKLVRLKSTLSFCGEITQTDIEKEKGFFIKPSDKSEVKIWIPYDEVECIIHNNGKIEKGAEINGGGIL